MKAVVQVRYGAPAEVLSLQEIDLPSIGEEGVRVRVRAASVHADIWHVVTGKPYVLRLMGAGLSRPKDRVPGTDMAGMVESVGKKVTRFRAGDEVFGETLPGMQWRNGGAYAEYVTVHQDALAIKPNNLTFEQAAAVPTSGFIAWFNLVGEGKLQPGQRVLINGAAGGVGSIAIQVAKAFGAHVTGVDRTDKLDMLASLGADKVIDYTLQDFTRLGERYDLILDVASNLSFSACRRALTANGKYVLIGHDHYGSKGGRIFGSLPRFLRLALLSFLFRQLPRPTAAFPDKKETLAALLRLLEAGKITPIVDRVFPMEKVVEAIRYLAEGKARGKIILTP